MQNTDMVLWQGKDEGKVKDLYSVGYGTPEHKDEPQDYTKKEVKKVDDSYEFTTTRLLNTGDSKDYKITLGKDKVRMIWASNKDTADF